MTGQERYGSAGEHRLPLAWSKERAKTVDTGVLSADYYTFQAEGAGDGDRALRMAVVTGEDKMTFRIRWITLNAVDGAQTAEVKPTKMDITINGQLGQQDVDFVASQLAELQFQIAGMIDSTIPHGQVPPAS